MSKAGRAHAAGRSQTTQVRMAAKGMNSPIVVKSVGPREKLKTVDAACIAAVRYGGAPGGAPRSDDSMSCMEGGGVGAPLGLEG